jgi:two-component system NarL family sensor kinase
VTTSSAPLVLAMTLLGAAPAVAMCSLSLIAGAVHDRLPRPELAANLANYAAFCLIGGLVSDALSRSLGLEPSDLAFALVVLVAYALAVGLSHAFNATTGHLLYGDPIWKRMWWQSRDAPASEGPTALLTAAICYVYGTTGGVPAVGLLAFIELLSQYFARGMLISRDRARALERQTQQLAELSASRGRLVGQVIAAEESERRRLAEALHDEALQNLLVAQRGLATLDDRGIDDARTGIGRTIEELRNTIFNLHPTVLETTGLAAALRAVAAQQAERAGFRFEVDVDEHATGIHDSLLFVLGREQLTNVAKHAGAADVALVVTRNGDELVMDVRDDGCGITPERRGAALEHGHIGLASSAERVEAVGGSFDIESEPGRGTRIRTTIPLTLPS